MPIETDNSKHSTILKKKISLHVLDSFSITINHFLTLFSVKHSQKFNCTSWRECTSYITISKVRKWLWRVNYYLKTVSTIFDWLSHLLRGHLEQDNLVQTNFQPFQDPGSAVSISKNLWTFLMQTNSETKVSYDEEQRIPSTPKQSVLMKNEMTNRYTCGTWITILKF